MRLKHILSISLLLSAAVFINARDLVGFPEAANNYREYPENNLPEVGNAPKGYENFHIEHYGRHGSRWLIGTWRHDNAIAWLERCDTLAGGLTPRGREVLEEVKQARRDLKHHEGDLSDKGAAQHRGIARRMAKNFPGVFRKGAYVDARSTMIQRCIISMGNAVTELKGVQPELNLRISASEINDPYMKNVTDKPAIQAENNAQVHVDKYKNENLTDGKFLSILFNNPDEAKLYFDEDLFGFYLYEIASNSVSTGDQSSIAEIFSPEDIDRFWRRMNVQWYIRSGNTPLSGGLVPLRQRHLLRNIIASADTAVVSDNISANLRFGHEVIVIPLVVLMELDDYGKTYTDMNDLADNWLSYNIFPMACNVQMIFARPAKEKKHNPEDVLVKVLLNEKPAKLPVPAVEGDYVRWTDLRKHYIDRFGMED